jgi:hypothetical protein
MLNVRDVIFLLDKKRQNLVPCQIVEIISSITIEGEKIHHIVMTPSEKTLKLEEFQGPWFTSIDKAQDFLLKAASELIQKAVDKALSVANENFGSSNSERSDDISFFESQKNVLDKVQNLDESVKIDLGDGQIATVTLPSEMLDAKNLTS